MMCKMSCFHVKYVGSRIYFMYQFTCHVMSYIIFMRSHVMIHMSRMNHVQGTMMSTNQVGYTS